jgi:hypothetical protein
MLIKIYPLYTGQNWVTILDGVKIVYDGITTDGSDWEIRNIAETPAKNRPLLIGTIKTSLGTKVLHRILEESHADYQTEYV